MTRTDPFKQADFLLGDAAYMQRKPRGYWTKVINKYFREHDESHLWPINGRFNVTERAICKVTKNWYSGTNIEYFLAIDATIRDIVNNDRNW